MKIITILGARPQFIKAGAVSRIIAEHKEIEEIIVHTGQHYDKNMSDYFFNQLEIPKPKYMLSLGGSTHGAMTGIMMRDLEEIFINEKPDFVMVYGDTNSTIAGALTASKLHIKVAHVEAGLRSFNMKMPEEINRILTDRISNILFCPTDAAIENLKKEGFENFDIKIVNNGDVMQDAALFYGEKSEEYSSILEDLKLKPNEFVLTTCHRAENTDDEERLTSIFAALDEINKDTRVVLPLHPRTKKFMEQFNIKTEIMLIDPVNYFDMIKLLKNCKLVATDSGGLQKEAFFFSKPCITMRDETEWVELIEGGFNFLAGAEQSKIVNAFKNLESFSTNYEKDLYGKGKASQRIVEELLKMA